LTSLEIGPIQFFGTAYDPTDLPGTSIDPLGFEAGYVALADVLLPGLTTITETPRYAGMLCAGLSLVESEADPQFAPVAAEEQSLESLLRLERLWALASVLRWREHPDERDSTFGPVRGITYATAQAEIIEAKRLTQVSPDYPFLRRQRIQGAIGVYRSFLEKCGLLFPNEWRLTPDLGEGLGEAFARDTAMPAVVKRSIRDGSAVPVAALRGWGQYAHPTRPLMDEEKRFLREAVLTNPHRHASLSLLRSVGVRWLQTPGGELLAVGEMLTRLRAGKTVRGVNPDVYPSLTSALTVIPAYEAAYRTALLGFERVLWLVRQSPGGVATEAVLRDSIVNDLPKMVATVARGLTVALDAAAALDTSVRSTLADAADFVRALGRPGLDSGTVVETLLHRHKDIQEGKLERGRRKMPWIVRDKGAYCLTFARVGGLDRPVTNPSAITAHDYRLRNGRRFLAALDIGE
jgi:hypothetical protein